MKQIVFTGILIFVFCLTVSAQRSESSCQKININAPETVQMKEAFKVSASFEQEKQPSVSKFNWTIINGNEVFKINNSGIIELDSKNSKNSELIIALAESLDEKCQNTAIAKIFVVPPCVLPFTIDEYEKIDSKDERIRLEAVAIEMQRFKDSELFVSVEFRKKTFPTEIKNHLAKILAYLTINNRLEKNKITFLVSESENERVKFQPLPKDFNANICDDCFLIRGEDLERIVNLFKPKQTTKISKR